MAVNHGARDVRDVADVVVMIGDGFVTLPGCDIRNVVPHPSIKSVSCLSNVLNVTFVTSNQVNDVFTLTVVTTTNFVLIVTDCTVYTVRRLHKGTCGTGLMTGVTTFWFQGDVGCKGRTD